MPTTTATAYRAHLAAAVGVSPRKLASGTLRALLEAVGWQLVGAGRIKVRAGARDIYSYRAQRVALPSGVCAEALAALWLEQLQQPPMAGAFSPPVLTLYRGEKSPTALPALARPWPLASVIAIPWAAGPPRQPVEATQ
jgi:hypothetical protein